MRASRENILAAAGAGHKDAFLCIYSLEAHAEPFCLDDLVCPGDAALAQLQEFGLPPLLTELGGRLQPFQVRAERFDAQRAVAILASW